MRNRKQSSRFSFLLISCPVVNMTKKYYVALKYSQLTSFWTGVFLRSLTSRLRGSDDCILKMSFPWKREINADFDPEKTGDPGQKKKIQAENYIEPRSLITSKLFSSKNRRVLLHIGVVVFSKTFIFGFAACILWTLASIFYAISHNYSAFALYHNCQCVAVNFFHSGSWWQSEGCWVNIFGHLLHDKNKIYQEK